MKPEWRDRLVPDGGWACPSGPRIAVPPPAARGLLFRSLSRLSRLLGRPQLPNVFPVININRRLFRAWLFFASRLMPFGRLPPAVRELVILRVAWNCRSRYEWAQHLELAQRVGVADAEILAAAGSTDAAPASLRVLFRAVDAMCRKEPVDDEDWAALAQRFDEPALIELLMLVGQYEMVAGVLVNAAVPLEPAIEENFRRFQSRM